jgi:guanyl-specific ribonuclease Sa
MQKSSLRDAAAQEKAARLTHKQTKKISRNDRSQKSSAPCRKRPKKNKNKTARQTLLQQSRPARSEQAVQPVHQGGSTAFNQDGPGEHRLKIAELKFSC